MKPYTFGNILLPGLFFLLFTSFALTSSAQNESQKLKSAQEVIKGFKGWDNNRDTNRVYISDDFTNEEKDSIRTAIARWNGAGCTPPMKEVEAEPAEIVIKEDPDLPANKAGRCRSQHTNGWVYHSEITINPNHAPISLTELVTHELGHAYGLDDTKSVSNPNDCMRGSGSNNNDGNLSAHDSTELKATTTILQDKDSGEIPIKKDKHRLIAFLPGENGPIAFATGINQTPEQWGQTEISINTLDNPFIQFGAFLIENNDLVVEIVVSPELWAGKFYLDITITPPAPAETTRFFGVHYVSEAPVVPIEFECPFEIGREGELTTIMWQGNTTYPYTGKLRAYINVDDSLMYHQKGGGDFTLKLQPGTHKIELFVDDFQGNEAYKTETFDVTHAEEFLPDPDEFLFEVYPNPFTGFCNINADVLCEISIYDLMGHLIKSMPGGSNTWYPGKEIKKGTYIVHAKLDGLQKRIKVVYFE